LAPGVVKSVTRSFTALREQRRPSFALPAACPDNLRQVLTVESPATVGHRGGQINDVFTR